MSSARQLIFLAFIGKIRFEFNETPDPSSSDRDTPDRDTPDREDGNKREEGWRKRTSMQRALGEETDSIASMEEVGFCRSVTLRSPLVLVLSPFMILRVTNEVLSHHNIGRYGRVDFHS